MGQAKDQFGGLPMPHEVMGDSQSKWSAWRAVLLTLKNLLV